MLEQTPSRVLHVIDHMGLGGAQTFLFELALAQRESPVIDPVVCWLTEPTQLSRRFRGCGIPIHICAQEDAIRWRSEAFPIVSCNLCVPKGLT